MKSKITAKASSLRRVFGTSELPAKSLWLAAGQLRIRLRDGNLGAIMYGETEVLRGISFLVRNENWGICPTRISALAITRRRKSFVVQYKAIAANGHARLIYHVAITATPHRLVFHARAASDRDFKTNRAGFVVLHPINGLAGRPLVVTHADGSKEHARFPKLVSPSQPVFKIRALEYAPGPGLKAKVLMEGQEFEMEDQRNWTDASYKTYVRSLLDPWPYVLKAGDAFEQKVTVTVVGRALRKIGTRAHKLKTGKYFTLPEIGIGIPQQEAHQSLRHIDDLKVLAPKHLVCTLDGDSNMVEACKALADLNKNSSIPLTLEVVLPCQDPVQKEVAQVADAVKLAGFSPRRIVITQVHDLKSFQPTDKRPWGPSYEEMAIAVRKHFPGAAIGGGMISYFAELNRKRPPEGLFDFITHSICPIVHDASDAAVMQTLESLPDVFASTKGFIGRTPYHLGPSGIGARMNPYGASLANNPDNRRVCMAPNDPRQKGTFAPAWNLGVLIAAGQAGLRSVTLSALCGPQGLFDDKGRKVPLFDFLAGATRLSRRRAVSIFSSNPWINGFIVEDEKSTTAWLLNRGNETAVVTLGEMRVELLSFEMRVVQMS